MELRKKTLTIKLTRATLFNSLRWKRLALIALLLSPLFLKSTHEMTVNVISDAFWQVGVYIAATLFIYRIITLSIETQSWRWHRHRYGQVAFATLLGVLPGCGGAIVIMTQYVKGQIHFGAVVAVLTATMGDAAFLLLASDPINGGKILVISALMGLIVGSIIVKTHPTNFLLPKIKNSPHLNTISSVQESSKKQSIEKKIALISAYFWRYLLLPASLIALLGSFQVDVTELFEIPSQTLPYLGTTLGICCLIFWALEENQDCCTNKKNTHWGYVAKQTHGILIWVIGAFIIFEISLFLFEKLAHFHALPPTQMTQFLTWLPLFGVLVGLIPGCGPQILVTTAYLSGSLPFSVQLGNALSNDGDALFPAIAMAPKAAFIATLYSAIPALIASYSYFYLFE